MGNVHVRMAMTVLFSVLWVLMLSPTLVTSFSDKSEQQDPNLGDVEKRRIDRYSMFSQLGKRSDYQENEGIDISDRGMNSMMFHGGLRKQDDGEGAEIPAELVGLEPDNGMDDLEKKGRVDRFGFTGMLGKRKFDRYGFIGSLGKRKFDRYGFIGSLGKRKFDRYGFIGSLGKRKFDRYGFIGSLGKRDNRYLTGDAASELDGYPFADTWAEEDPESSADVMDKRARMDRYSFYGALGKRGVGRPMQFSGQLGKRRMDLTGVLGQLGKRSKRATAIPWSVLVQRYPHRYVRGMDRYSFMSRLGKRKPNYAFYPQLGKRSTDNTYDDLDSMYGYDAQL